MPVRTRNGLVHTVKESAITNELYGLTVCGIRYMRKQKGTLWESQGINKTRFYKIRPSSRKPTCVACVAGIRTMSLFL